MGGEFTGGQVVEVSKRQFNSPMIFAGFVGAGLVGPITIGHMVKHLGMQEVAYMRSRHMRPATVFTSGRLRHPFRIYANKEGSMCAVVCEVTLKEDGVYDIIGALLDWAGEKNAGEIIIVDGVAGKEHDNKAYCAAEDDLCRVMADRDIDPIPQGYITGVPGGILSECLLRKIRGVTMLAKANSEGPDPEAASTIVRAINRMYETDIDTAELEKEKEKIGSEFKDMSRGYSEDRKKYSGMYM